MKKSLPPRVSAQQQRQGEARPQVRPVLGTTNGVAVGAAQLHDTPTLQGPARENPLDNTSEIERVAGNEALPTRVS